MADDDKKTMFDIAIGVGSWDSKILVNGEDISAAIRGCKVECIAGDVTKITLMVSGVNARVTVQGAIDKENVEVITNG